MIVEITNPPEGGTLLVGIDPRRGEVVVNLDHDRVGHITFSPDQARQFAAILNQKAAEAEQLVAEQIVIVI